jgi:hypothetical protein
MLIPQKMMDCIEGLYTACQNTAQVIGENYQNKDDLGACYSQLLSAINAANNIGKENNNG